jgi:YgiT-type zinc finger domain-containing protein
LKVRKFLKEEFMKCVICKHGHTKEGLTTVTFDRDDLTLVVKEVPAQVCTNCGEDYVDEHVAHEILGIAERMHGKGRCGSGCPEICGRICRQLLILFLIGFLNERARIALPEIQSGGVPKRLFLVSD